MSPSARRILARGLLAAAVGWPFLVSSPQAHRVGVHALAALLLAASLVVMVGWLRTITFFQTAALASGALATAWLLGTGQSLPVALAAAVLVGAATGVVSLLLAGGRPRTALPLASLALAAVVALALLPRMAPQPFQRPLLLGLDLSGERPLYLLGLAVVALVLSRLAVIRRAAAGRRLVAVGAGEGLALRCGVDLRRAWLEGVALAGGMAGLAGWLLAVQARGLPEAGTYSLATAVVVLAYPLLGGAGSLAGAGVLAVVLTVVSAWGGGALLQHTVLAGAALILAVLLRGDGLAGAFVGARRRLRTSPVAARWGVTRR